MCFCLSRLLVIEVFELYAFDVSTIPFNKGFSHLFGDANILHAAMILDVTSSQQNTGSGFKSSDLYNHGFFSAKIKLPSDYTAGSLFAFYTTDKIYLEDT
ncbi:hypothetical protein HAX54_018867 [Datura stramonium]|uniref:GH16 domain-containing protein n=1 Tax=Datura stramonium TaxID=4076 RepID=A0ABS8RJE3_DATST|nr:hypothetical protein [Datura stramonium]